MKAMSLVPDEVRGFFDLVSHQYMPPLAMRDFSREYRAISISRSSSWRRGYRHSISVSIERPVTPCCSVRAA